MREKDLGSSLNLIKKLNAIQDKKQRELNIKLEDTINDYIQNIRPHLSRSAIAKLQARDCSQEVWEREAQFSGTENCNYLEARSGLCCASEISDPPFP